MASLSRFISWLREHGTPLYKLLKKSDQFYCNEEVQEAFDKLKSLPSLAPDLGLTDLE